MNVDVRLAVGLVFWLFTGSAALAQDKPWVLFLDNQSASVCDVVNADNAELVVLQGTGQLRIVSGTDVTLTDAIVDDEGFVTFEEKNGRAVVSVYPADSHPADSQPEA